jgi:curli biogenesis system outer membrane secretion channel CsgG
MTKRIVPLAVACIAALVAVLPAAAKTPPSTTVAKVGIEVAKLGLATGDIDTATSKCTSKACLSKSYTAFYNQAHTLDGALEALWNAAGKSGRCASAVVNAAAGFESLTGSYHGLEAATLKNDKPAATKAYGEIQTKTPRLTAIISSFKTKCR